MEQLHVELREGGSDELIGKVHLIDGKAVGDKRMGDLV